MNVVPAKPQQPQPRTSFDPVITPVVPAATPPARPGATGATATSTSGDPNNSQTELLVLSGALVDALLAHRDHLVYVHVNAEARVIRDSRP